MSNESYCLPANEAFSRRYYRVLSETRDAAICFVRRSSLFLAKSPHTPLRVMCIMAFDVVHVLDKSRPLSREKITLLANVLDFAACVNSSVDGKCFNSKSHQRSRAGIDNAEAGQLIDDFVIRLREIESRGRKIPSDSHACENGRVYRESVVRLNMGVLAAIAFDLRSLDEGIKFTRHKNLDILFRIVMLLQIIDDIIDYRDDLSRGLPSFLTVSDLHVTLTNASRAAEIYGRQSERSSTEDCYPFRF